MRMKQMLASNNIQVVSECLIGNPEKTDLLPCILVQGSK